MMRIVTFICLFIGFSHHLRAQDNRFQHITTDHDLSQNSVEDVVEDHRRYMWLATQDEWMYNGNNQIASFTNIDPDAYTFRVIATDQHNSWIEKSSDQSFEIIPAFWQTLLFQNHCIVVSPWNGLLNIMVCI